ncbi:LysR family transcriptional regulator [Phenylobacterium sp. Root700]|uniref:LysR family transcriptional regulator n=1 Tax=Phenylobacterium sp. Root700 TaxID=1736591 RepID=UPI0006F36454|nr:LysR family transcriptional regulator [Phenylobacterium sp. Root700]KRB48866.1 LysR family transcriptional regulator [Phenylobacterium sp. Root700]
MNVTLKQIRAFVAIADSASFTAAAVVVNSTQSSLSVLIRELEQAVGLRLIDRTTRKTALTEAGQEYLIHARRVLAEVEHAELSTKELVARKRGRVVVAAPPIIAAVLLPPIVAEFHSKYPNISIVVEDVPPSDIVPGVAAGQIDCGLGVFGRDPLGVQIQPLIEEKLVLIGSADHPLMSGASVKWSELRGHSVVAIRAPADIRRELDTQLRLAGVPQLPILEVRQMLTVLGMVSAGLGVAVWPSWAVGLLEAFSVQARPLVAPVARMPFSVITPESRELSPAAVSFLAVLTEGVKRNAALIEQAMPALSVNTSVKLLGERS